MAPEGLDFSYLGLARQFLAPDPSDIDRYRRVNKPAGVYQLPEGRLWHAAMELAVIDLLRPLKQTSHKSALVWIRDAKCKDAASFNFVAETLGLDPSATRRALLKALVALGGSKVVTAKSWRKETTKLKGIKLCQKRPVTLERLASDSTVVSTYAPTIQASPQPPTAITAEVGTTAIPLSAPCL